MAFDVGPKKGVRPAMNVTPLVDVVLVLLIIFMVITPLMLKQFRVAVPEKAEETAAAPAPDEQAPVVLTVLADGKVKLNRDEIADRELPERLQRVFAARSDRLLFFQADDAVPYGRATDVLDLARGGGAATIAVMPDPLVAP